MDCRWGRGTRAVPVCKIVLELILLVYFALNSVESGLAANETALKENLLSITIIYSLSDRKSIHWFAIPSRLLSLKLSVIKLLKPLKSESRSIVILLKLRSSSCSLLPGQKDESPIAGTLLCVIYSSCNDLNSMNILPIFTWFGRLGGAVKLRIYELKTKFIDSKLLL